MKKENPTNLSPRDEDATMTDVIDYTAISAIYKRFRTLTQAEIDETRAFWNECISGKPRYITGEFITPADVYEKDPDGMDGLRLRLPSGITGHKVDVWLFYPDTWHPKVNVPDVCTMLANQRVDLEDALQEKKAAPAVEYRRLLRQTAKTILTACDELDCGEWRRLPDDLPLDGFWILYKAKGANRD